MTSFGPYLFTFIGTLLLLSNGGLSYDKRCSSFKTSNSDFFLGNNVQTLRPIILSTPPQQVSIVHLLTNGSDYHQQLVSVRGVITQPELHLDQTELYVDFVFRLSQGNHSMVVYGQHDRTRGAPSIIINRSVEVIGTFWKEQDRKGVLIFNILEAFSVTPYPSSIPGST